MSCVMRTTPAPEAAKFFIMETSAAAASQSSPAAGSSSTRYDGRAAITEVIATLRFCPPESPYGDRSSNASSRPASRAASLTRFGISASGTPQLRGAKAISSKTLSEKICSSGYWKTRPTLLRTRRVSAALLPVSSPSATTRPLCGAIRPFRCCASVDFPLPVCPRTETIRPSLHSNDTFERAARADGRPALYV